MPTIPSFMLTEAVTVEPYEGETGSGGPAYGDAVAVKAHVEEKRALVIKREGREIHATGLLLFAPTVTVPPESRVTVWGSTYRVLHTARIPSPGGGVHHLEVAIG